MNGRQTAIQGLYFIWQIASLLFSHFTLSNFAIIRGPPVLIQYIMLYVIFLLTVSKEVPRKVFS
jgi:hypothetical protein